MKIFLYAIAFFWTAALFPQEKFDAGELVDFRTGMNAVFRENGKSPLLEEDRAVFTGLDFFPADEKYFVYATLKRTPDEAPFEMKTTTTRKPMYRKYAEVYFTIDGKPLKLNIYQNIELSKKEEYKDNLFLPFTDLTSGNETYAGGRYIEVKIPDGNTVSIDFNKAYNPYCAYNKKYSCPVVPPENDLQVEIRAGVKKFHD